MEDKCSPIHGDLRGRITGTNHTIRLGLVEDGEPEYWKTGRKNKKGWKDKMMGRRQTQYGTSVCGGGERGLITPQTPGFACSMQMWTNAPRAQASVAAESAKTCRALSAAFARLASVARRVKKMWMNVPNSLRPAGQAAATTPQARSTAPAQLASTPEDQGPLAKVRVLGPCLQHLGLLWGMERDITWK